MVGAIPPAGGPDPHWRTPPPHDVKRSAPLEQASQPSSALSRDRVELSHQEPQPMPIEHDPFRWSALAAPFVVAFHWVWGVFQSVVGLAKNKGSGRAVPPPQEGAGANSQQDNPEGDRQRREQAARQAGERT